MLYLFTGTDSHKTRAKAFAWVEAARKKEPSASYVRIEGKSITEGAIDELLVGQGLFFSKLLVLIDEPFETKSSEELILSRLKEIEASKNPIALLAPGISAGLEKKLGKHAFKLFREDSKEKKVSRGFNSALVNALGERNGRALWLELKKSEREGDAPEALHGLLHWKARDMMQKGSRTWSKEEARALSMGLIILLSDARRGNLSLSEHLEQFALAL